MIGRVLICRALLVVIVGLLLTGCGPSYEHAAAARTVYAHRADGPILVAVLDDPTLPGYLDGIRLARDEVLAARDGLLLGRALRLDVQPGGGDYRQLLPVMRRIATDPRISAVLGHRSSEIAIPASVVYDAARILFLPPFATRKQLTLHGSEFVLRMLPDNTVMARQSASLAHLFGYRRMVVLHARDDYARELAFLFEDAAREAGIELVFRGSFFANEQNYRGLLGQLAGVDFDAIYLSAETADGARILSQLREMGFDAPVIGSDRLNAGGLAAVVGTAGERTIVPMVYNIDARGPRNAHFIAAFAQAYGAAPNQNAAQGYDSLHLLAEIIARTGSTEPQVLSTSAHYGPPWVGLTGIYAFDASGNLYGKRYGFQVLRFGRWWSMPGVTIPYVMATFRELQQRRALVSTLNESAREQAEAGGARAPSAPSEPVAEASAPAPASEDPYDLRRLSERHLDRAGRNRIWLALARDLLGFRRLGVVAPSTDAGRSLGSLARGVGADRDFSVLTCELPAVAAEDTDAEADEAETDAEVLRRAAIACWSRLAQDIDALLIPVNLPLEPALVRRLNHTLREYGVASFTLADAVPADFGLTLALVASGIDLDDPAVALRFDGLLKGQRVGELNRRLANLPTISADLAALQALGRLPSAEALVLISSAIEPPRPDPAATAAVSLNTGTESRSP